MDSMRSRTTDQADGLRRLFAGQRQRVVPLVANPHVSESAVLLERLSSALAELGASVLVVDAADTSPDPSEMIDVDLASCIESLGGAVHYLAARGEPMRHVNARGSAEFWLHQVSTLAPRADVLLVHASARDLARLLGRRAVRPILMGSLQAESLTDAYASMKLLTQRSRLMCFDLLVATEGQLSRAHAFAERLAATGDGFLGTVVRSFAPVDCRQPLQAALPASLMRLAGEQLQHDEHLIDAPVLAPESALSAPVMGRTPHAHPSLY